MLVRCLFIYFLVTGLFLFAQEFELTQYFGSEYFKHDTPVRGISLSPDGNYILTGDAKYMAIWDRKTGVKVRTIGHVEHGITDLQYVGDGKTIALEDSC